jgi:hypothetical protein
MAQKPKPTRRIPAKTTELLPDSTMLLADLRELIEASRSAVAQAVNSALVLLYWQVGSRIRADVLRAQRAAYAEQILPTLSAKLAPEYGQGFGERNLARMIRFAEVFPDREIVLGLSRKRLQQKPENTGVRCQEVSHHACFRARLPLKSVSG